MNKLVIRPARTEDAESIIQVYNSNPVFCRTHLGREKVDAAFVFREQEEMKRIGFLSCVITEKEQVIGVLDYRDDEPVYLSLMMLGKPFQHCGMGSICYGLFEEEMRQLGRKRIRADVVDACPGNALSFWQKQGFAISGSTELDWNGQKNRARTIVKNIGEREETVLTQPWLRWAVEIQSIAQNGLAYCRDVYDQERYERLREIAAEMLSHKSGIPLETVKTLFCAESGYQTPKLDTRAAIIEDGKILLVQEKNGQWSLPGGWVDVTESIASNTVKEVREEAGLEVRAERIAALHDRNRHNPPPYAYNICKVFVLCTRLGGSFRPNSETIASGWFAPDDLPPLAEAKNTREQIALCFAAAKDPAWQTQFD